MSFGSAGLAQKLLVLGLGGAAFAGAQSLVSELVDKPSRYVAAIVYALGAVGYAIGTPSGFFDVMERWWLQEWTLPFLPLLRDGQLTGVLWFNCDHPRAWSPRDVTFKQGRIKLDGYSAMAFSPRCSTRQVHSSSSGVECEVWTGRSTSSVTKSMRALAAQLFEYGMTKVIPTAMMGAPTCIVEKLPQGLEAAASLRRLEQHLGKTAFATMPIRLPSTFTSQNCPPDLVSGTSATLWWTT